MADTMTYASTTRPIASPRIDAGRVPAPGFFSALIQSAPPELPGVPQGAYSFFLNPLTPVIFGLLYFGVTKVASHYSDGKNRISGKRWNAVIFLHNALLAVYSGWTFALTGPNFFGAFWRAWSEGGVAGLTHVFCDSNLAAWTTTQFPWICFGFYLSKFWEVLDTVIILLKGKKVGMLQSYHHTGAMITMWAGYRSMAMPIWIFVVFNSFIHTMMYLYYSLTAIKVPFPNLLKRSLTKLQISQFILGGSLAASYLFITLPSLPYTPSFEHVNFGQQFGKLSLASLERTGTQCLIDAGQRTAVYLNVFYLIPLTYLFAAFFVNSYRRKANAGKGAKAVKKE